MSILVCEWHGWDGSLLKGILKKRRVDILSIKPGDSATIIIEKMNSQSYEAMYFAIDLSYTEYFPADRYVLQSLFPTVRFPNLLMTDIRKSHLQRWCSTFGVNYPTTTKEGDPEERLFIKSDYNHEGLREATLNKRQASVLHLPHDNVLNPEQVYIVVRRSELTNEWEDKSLHITKYITSPTRHIWRGTRFGDRAFILKAFSPGGYVRRAAKLSGTGINDTGEVTNNMTMDGVTPMIGTNDSYWYYFGSTKSVTGDLPLPDGVRNIVTSLYENLNSHFYSFDIIEDTDGNFYLIDLNATPHEGRFPEHGINFLSMAS